MSIDSKILKAISYNFVTENAAVDLNKCNNLLKNLPKDVDAITIFNLNHFAIEKLTKCQFKLREVANFNNRCFK